MSECDVCGRHMKLGGCPQIGDGTDQSILECWGIGLSRLRAALATAEKAKAKLEREIQFVTAEHDKAWVLLGKENDKARALVEKNTRLRAELDEARANSSFVAFLSVASERDKLRASGSSAPEKALGALREARRIIFYMRPDYCRATCPGHWDNETWIASVHEATCIEASAWLAAPSGGAHVDGPKAPQDPDNAAPRVPR